jgi:hypothetical protein
LFERFTNAGPGSKEAYLRQVCGGYPQLPSDRQVLSKYLHNIKLAPFQCEGCGQKMNHNSPCIKDSLLHSGIVLHTSDLGRTWHGCYSKDGGRLTLPHSFYNA